MIGCTYGRLLGSGTSGGTFAPASSGRSSSVHTAATPASARAARASIDVHAGVGVRAPHQGHVEQARHAHVVEVAAVAGDEAAVFLPLR